MDVALTLYLTSETNVKGTSDVIGYRTYLKIDSCD